MKFDLYSCQHFSIDDVMSHFVELEPTFFDYIVIDRNREKQGSRPRIYFGLILGIITLIASWHYPTGSICVNYWHEKPFSPWEE